MNRALQTSFIRSESLQLLTSKRPKNSGDFFGLEKRHSTTYIGRSCRSALRLATTSGSSNTSQSCQGRGVSFNGILRFVVLATLVVVVILSALSLLYLLSLIHI